jgi:predicted nucleotidyltransferase
MPNGLTPKTLDTITHVLQRFSGVEEAYLFGSRAKGTHHKGSDIDIALKGNIDLRTLAKIRYILEEETTLPYHFDIVDYHTITHPDLKAPNARVGVHISHRPPAVA